MVTRRHLLAIAGALSAGSLAGCLEEAGSPGEGTPLDTPTPTPSPSPTPTPQPTPEYIVDHPSVPIDHPIELTVEVLQAQPGIPSEPVTLEITLSNPSEERVGYQPSEHVFFWGAEDDSFVLYPADVYDDQEFNEQHERWIAQEPLAFNPTIDTSYLDPGDSASETLHLLAQSNQDPSDDPPVEMTFERTFEIGPAPSDGQEQLEALDWSFTLVLTDGV